MNEIQLFRHVQNANDKEEKQQNPHPFLPVYLFHAGQCMQRQALREVYRY